MPDTGLCIEVNVAAQKIRLLDGPREIWSAPCSTSGVGTGSEEGSFRTPLGRFHIDEKIGHGAPLGSVFKSRVPTGEIWQPGQEREEDLVLTRILWLAGDEPHNANTKSRYIYIHGTNHENRIGIPDSHGCIRLRNADIVTLYDRVEIGTPVVVV
jgi:lipoprotein-anchoring transpeptidase ErfK/SrfK